MKSGLDDDVEVHRRGRTGGARAVLQSLALLVGQLTGDPDHRDALAVRRRGDLLVLLERDGARCGACP